MSRTDDTYLKQLQARYRKASRQEKTIILDEYVKTTGYHRKHATAVLRRPTHHALQVLIGVAKLGQDGHHAGAGQDTGLGELLHGGKALLRRRGKLLHLTQAVAVVRVGGVDDAPHHHRPRPLVDLLQQVEVAQHEGRALQHRDRKAQPQADFQHPPGQAKLALGRLVVAGADNVYRRATQRPAQQGRCILFDLDHVAEVIEILKGTVAPLPTVAEEAPMLAALVGIGRIARPEPMIWALVFVEDDLGPVGHKLYSPCHGLIVSRDEEKVKLT
jgi:hypothetical protein